MSAATVRKYCAEAGRQTAPHIQHTSVSFPLGRMLRPDDGEKANFDTKRAVMFYTRAIDLRTAHFSTVEVTAFSTFLFKLTKLSTDRAVLSISASSPRFFFTILRVPLSSAVPQQIHVQVKCYDLFGNNNDLR